MSVAEAMLGNDGAIASLLGEGYEVRPEQLRMSERVTEAMIERGKLLVEAGTGIGKSFAYLAAAAERACLRGETIVIATNTIALQEQLVGKDVPVLEEAVERLGWADEPGGRKLKAVLVKGRGNYVSIRRLKLASERQAKLLPDAAGRRSLHVIEDWAYETEDGSLSTMPPLERPGVWDKVQSDSGNCMGRRCPFHDSCFYQSARREMEGANLLICNHALFFSDLALRARGTGFLPRYDHVVLDEAHGIEDAAADHFGVSLSEGKIMHLLGSLVQRRTGKGYLPTLELAVGDFKPIERAIHLVGEAEAATRRLFEDLIRLNKSDAVRNGRIREASAVPNELSEIMNKLALRLKQLKEDAKTEADRFELNSYALRAGEIADAAEVLIDQTAEGYVYWVEVREGISDGRFSRGMPRVKLSCSPIEVGPLLKQHLFEKDHSTVLTSATLATKWGADEATIEHAEAAFAFTMERLGCEGANVLQLGSPFDYGRQVRVIVDESMPGPGGRDSRGSSYERSLAERIQEQVVATEGGAFVLFTSFRTLGAVAEMLEGPFEELGYPLLLQGRGGPRGELLERFRELDGAVLFGAASFWQGVDVRGDQLRNVIITRLPFEPPDRPLTEARCEKIEARGGSAFGEDSLPRAVIRFKQGFGRLIRSSEDRGRVVILDSRVVSKGYGRKFLGALPSEVEIERVGGWREEW